MVRAFIFAAVILFAGAAGAETVDGVVTAVLDGDTIVIGKRHIRLAHVDAPEKRQEWGFESSRALSSLCLGKQATAVGTKEDRGRLIADVTCDKRDVSQIMVMTGHAWVYTQFNGRPELRADQEVAQWMAIGLWSRASPLAPWEWRRADRK